MSGENFRRTLVQGDSLSGQPGMSFAVTRHPGDAPLYAQLADAILAGIQSGRLAPGDRVASEPELVRTYGVSRATAAKALEHLERAGHVRREQGRGTFVEARRLLKRRPELGSFTESVRRTGRAPTQRLLALERHAGGLADPLAAWLGGGPLVRIVRLRMVDGDPVGLHTTLLPHEVAERAGVDERSLSAEDASLYAVLDAAGVHPAEAEEHLQAAAASPQDAALLGVRVGTALMRVIRVSRDARGRPLEVVDARYAGDRFDYSVSLVRSGPAGEPTTREGHDAQQTDDGAPGRRTGHGGRVRQAG